MYHLTARANIGRLVFENDSERRQFLAVLTTTVNRHEWSCRAYCLLSTHYHLLVATPRPDVAAGMQYLNGRYAQWVNWSRDERGHLFDGRYHSVLVESEGHALELHRYIALNPVRAKLVPSPEEWRWSSFRAVLGLERPLGVLDIRAVFEEFGPTAVVARRRLRAFVRDAVASDVA